MLTQCPNCQTLFRVTDEQLQVALGRVHCGKCEHIFNAAAHFRESRSVPRPPNALVYTSFQAQKYRKAVPNDSVLTASQVSSDQARLAQVKLDLDRLESAHPDLGDLPIIDDVDDLLVEASRSSKASGRATHQVASQDKLKPWADANASQAQPSNLLEPRSEVRETKVEVESARAKRPVAPGFLKTDAVQNPTPTKSPRKQRQDDFTSMSDAAIPDVLLEDLDSVDRPAWTGVAWFAGSLVLAALLFGQYVFWNRAQLAQKVEYRPYILEACGLLGCKVPLYKDLRKIQVVDRMLALHPTENNFLILQVLIKNNGQFPQSFPNLELRFEGLAGNTVRLRRFTPEEYLPEVAKQEIAGGFGVNQQVRVKLEFLDPGFESSDYQIRFL